MKKGGFAIRLRKVSYSGNLTTADLARWFGRPHATMTAWLNGREPRGGPQDQEHARVMLDTLEMLVKKRKGFPLPQARQSERIKHLQAVRDAVLA